MSAAYGATLFKNGAIMSRWRSDGTLDGPIGYRGMPLFSREEVDRFRREGWWTDHSVADFVAVHASDPVRSARPAYVIGDEKLSWSDYYSCSGRLACALVDCGIGRDQRVAVLLPDGPTVHTVFLANERAGLVTVGIGARAGRKEIEHLLLRTEADTLVTFAEHRGEVAADLVGSLRTAGVPLRRHVVVPRFETDPQGPIVINGSPSAAQQSSPEPSLAIRPDDLALLNSTSGTTGLPKCVMHYQNRWFYVHRVAEAFGRLTPEDVILGAVPAPFGFGLWTAHFTPAYLGATVVVAERFDPVTTIELIEREAVTMLAAVSTQFIMLLNSPAMDKHDLSSLRVMFTGGEAIPENRALEFEERTGAAVLNFYGANESGIVTGTSLEDPQDRRIATAGKLVPGTELNMSDAGQPSSRGPAISPGYLDDDAANRQLFTEDGFVLHADLCELDAGGYLRVVGRASDIIIRGGKNISAAEVEQEVMAHPAVIVAAAVAQPDPVFGERVCVFAEVRAGSALDLDTLGSFLTDRGVSPEHRPERLILVEELPRSSGGKVAKAELRQRLRQA